MTYWSSLSHFFKRYEALRCVPWYGMEVYSCCCYYKPKWDNTPLCTYLLFLVLEYRVKAQFCLNILLAGVFVCVFMIYTYILGHSWNYSCSGFSPHIFLSLHKDSFYSYLDDNHSWCFTLLAKFYLSPFTYL